MKRLHGVWKENSEMEGYSSFLRSSKVTRRQVHVNKLNFYNHSECICYIAPFVKQRTKTRGICPFRVES